MTREHAETCMCDRCLVEAAVRAAISRCPDDPERQRAIVEAYCRGLNSRSEASIPCPHCGERGLPSVSGQVWRICSQHGGYWGHPDA